MHGCLQEILIKIVKKYILTTPFTQENSESFKNTHHGDLDL